MSKDFSGILLEIDRKLSRPTVEFIYRTAQEHQPQAKATLDDVLFGHPAGNRDPVTAFRSFVNEVITTSFAAGVVLGATDRSETMKARIGEWQQSFSSPGSGIVNG